MPCTSCGGGAKAEGLECLEASVRACGQLGLEEGWRAGGLGRRSRGLSTVRAQALPGLLVITPVPELPVEAR